MTSQRGNRLVAKAPWLLAAVLCAPPSLAAGTPTAPLFQDQQPFEMTLELPLRTLLRERQDRPEVDGVAVVPGPAGTPARLDVKVSTRGHNRLKMCSFPPLGLDFKRSQVDGTLFAGQNKLKLATMCRGVGNYDEYLELERLVYLLYQQVTDVSLQVRSVRMRYVDTEQGGETTDAPAFFLEHFDSLAARTGRIVLDVPTVPLGNLDSAALARVSLFEYLIGNTDWAATSAAEGRDCCHNMVPLVPANGAGPVVPFPYDFDSSGFVDAPYAEPSELVNTRSVRDRVYRGYCVSNPYLEEARAKLNAAQPAMESVIEAGRLTPKTQRKALDYLSEGFNDINDAKHWQRKIVDRCRGN
jgi:hypothetical protein